jgi:hypothetical protein
MKYPVSPVFGYIYYLLDNYKYWWHNEYIADTLGSLLVLMDINSCYGEVNAIMIHNQM